MVVLAACILQESELQVQTLPEGTPWYVTTAFEKSPYLQFKGCHQDHEEDLRVLFPMSGASRGHLPANAPQSRTSRPSPGHISRPLHQKASHMYGIHGRQPLSVDEGKGPQGDGSQKCEKYTLPDIVRTGPHPCTSLLPPRHQAREHPCLNIGTFRLALCFQQIFCPRHTTVDTSCILNQDCRLRLGSRDPLKIALHDICFYQMVQSTRGASTCRRIFGTC